MPPHPVAGLMRARRDAGSRPLARDDGARVAVILERDPAALRAAAAAARTCADAALGG